jgi:hypothetical protein
LVQNGTFQRPPIAMRLQDGLSVLDGNHRISALHVCRAGAATVLKKGGIVPPTKQQIWIGTHAENEVPIN